MTTNTTCERGDSRPPSAVGSFRNRTIPRRNAVSPMVQTASRHRASKALLIFRWQQTKSAPKFLDKIGRVGKPDRARDLHRFFSSHQPPAGFVKSQILHKQSRWNAKSVGELLNKIIF